MISFNFLFFSFEKDLLISLPSSSSGRLLRILSALGGGLGGDGTLLEDFFVCGEDEERSDEQESVSYVDGGYERERGA